MAATMQQPPLPGVSDPYVEGVVERIRKLYSGFTRKGPRPHAQVQTVFWDCVLDERGRRYFLQVVKLPAELATKRADELTAGELLTIFDGYLRLRDYMDQLSRSMWRARSQLPK
jgi:hypothetical protein